MEASDGEPSLPRGGTSSSNGTQIWEERLGGEPMNADKLRRMRFPPTLSEVDRTLENMRTDIKMISQQLGLPRVIQEEALSYAPHLLGITRRPVRERAVFCLYMAGKKHNSTKSDIMTISNVMNPSDRPKEFNPQWTQGRILRSVEQIYSKLDPDFAERIGPIRPTSVKDYISFIFDRLTSEHPKAIQGLRVGYKNADEIYDHNTETTLGYLTSGNPRNLAVEITIRALKDVRWKKLGVKPRHAVGARQVIAAAKISKKPVSEDETPRLRSHDAKVLHRGHRLLSIHDKRAK